MCKAMHLGILGVKVAGSIIIGRISFIQLSIQYLISMQKQVR